LRLAEGTTPCISMRMHHIFGRSEIIEATIKGRNIAIMRTSEENVRQKH
jgi:hypothetical protein